MWSIRSKLLYHYQIEEPVHELLLEVQQSLANFKMRTLSALFLAYFYSVSIYLVLSTRNFSEFFANTNSFISYRPALWKLLLFPFTNRKIEVKRGCYLPMFTQLANGLIAEPSQLFSQSSFFFSFKKNKG